MSIIGTEAFSTAGNSFGLTIPGATKSIVISRTASAGATTNIPLSLGSVALIDFPPLINSERREAITYGLDITGRSNDTLTLVGSGSSSDYIAYYLDELLAFVGESWSGLVIGSNTDSFGPVAGTLYVMTAAHSQMAVAGDIAWQGTVTQTNNAISDGRRLLQGYATGGGAVPIGVTRSGGLPGSDILTGWVRSAFSDDVGPVEGGSGMVRRRRGYEDAGGFYGWG
jgi:hypothetical protein